MESRNGFDASRSTSLHVVRINADDEANTLIRPDEQDVYELLFTTVNKNASMSKGNTLAILQIIHERVSSQYAMQTEFHLHPHKSSVVDTISSCILSNHGKLLEQALTTAISLVYQHRDNQQYLGNSSISSLLSQLIPFLLSPDKLELLEKAMSFLEIVASVCGDYLQSLQLLETMISVLKNFKDFDQEESSPTLLFTTIYATIANMLEYSSAVHQRHMLIALRTQHLPALLATQLRKFGLRDMQMTEHGLMLMRTILAVSAATRAERVFLMHLYLENNIDELMVELAEGYLTYSHAVLAAIIHLLAQLSSIHTESLLEGALEMQPVRTFRESAIGWARGMPEILRWLESRDVEESIDAEHYLTYFFHVWQDVHQQLIVRVTAIQESCRDVGPVSSLNIQQMQEAFQRDKELRLAPGTTSFLPSLAPVSKAAGAAAQKDKSVGFSLPSTSRKGGRAPGTAGRSAPLDTTSLLHLLGATQLLPQSQVHTLLRMLPWMLHMMASFAEYASSSNLLEYSLRALWCLCGESEDAWSYMLSLSPPAPKSTALVVVSDADGASRSRAQSEQRQRATPSTPSPLLLRVLFVGMRKHLPCRDASLSFHSDSLTESATLVRSQSWISSSNAFEDDRRHLLPTVEQLICILHQLGKVGGAVVIRSLLKDHNALEALPKHLLDPWALWSPRRVLFPVIDFWVLISQQRLSSADYSSADQFASVAAVHLAEHYFRELLQNTKRMTASEKGVRSTGDVSTMLLDDDWDEALLRLNADEQHSSDVLDSAETQKHTLTLQCVHRALVWMHRIAEAHPNNVSRLLHITGSNSNSSHSSNNPALASMLTALVNFCCLQLSPRSVSTPSSSLQALWGPGGRRVRSTGDAESHTKLPESETLSSALIDVLEEALDVIYVLSGGTHAVVAVSVSMSAPLTHMWVKAGFVKVLVHAFTLSLVSTEVTLAERLLALVIIFGAEHKFSLGSAGICQQLDELLRAYHKRAATAVAECLEAVDDRDPMDEADLKALHTLLVPISHAVGHLSWGCDENLMLFAEELKTLEVFQQCMRTVHVPPIVKRELVDTINVLKFHGV